MSTDATALPPAIRANLEAVLPMLRDLYREDRPAVREQRAAALIDWAAGLCAALAAAVQERDTCRRALREIRIIARSAHRRGETWQGDAAEVLALVRAALLALGGEGDGDAE